MKSFSSPFVFSPPSAVFSMSLHASSSAALPTGFWFMNPRLLLLPQEGNTDGPICRVCHQENPFMSTNIMNIFLTTCGPQLLRLRWCEVIYRDIARNSSPWLFNFVVRCIGQVHEVLPQTYFCRTMFVWLLSFSTSFIWYTVYSDSHDILSCFLFSNNPAEVDSHTPFLLDTPRDDLFGKPGYYLILF